MTGLAHELGVTPGRQDPVSRGFLRLLGTRPVAWGPARTRRRREGEPAVIGSNFGQDHHPAWVHNVLADPAATISLRRRSVAVRVREANADEAQRIWAAGAEVYPGFAAYRRATTRPIKVFLVEKEERAD